MKISTKIFSINVFSLAMIIVIAGINYGVVKKILGHSTEILNEEVDPLLDINKVEQQTTEVMLLTIRHLSLTEAEEMAVIEKKVQEDLARLNNLLNEYESLNNEKEGFGEQLATLRNAWDEFIKIMNTAFKMNREFDQEGALLLVLSEGQEKFQAAKQPVREMVAAHREKMSQLRKQSEEMLPLLQSFLGAAGVLIAAVFAVFFYGIRNYIILPLRSAVSAIAALGANRLNFPVPAERLKGNGEIAEVFRSYREAQSNLSGVVSGILTSVDELSNVATDLKDVAGKTVDQSGEIRKETAEITEVFAVISQNTEAVAAANEQASSNLKSVSLAVGDLSEKIRSVAAESDQSHDTMDEVNGVIGRIFKDIDSVAESFEMVAGAMTDVAANTKEALNISTKANEKAHQTMETMQRLTEIGEKIGGVVRLIDSIAGQTNMLALNATIEAASAGEAGKGFAVVASEVKDLAQQTSKANNEIGQQIQEIQNCSRGAVEHTRDIVEIIEQVSSYNTSIDAVVQEQNRTAAKVKESVAAVAEASRVSSNNLEQSAAGIKSIRNSMSDASRQAEESARNLAEATSGVTEIAKSSAETAGNVRKAGENVQGINAVAEGMNDLTGHTQQNANLLSRLAGGLRNSAEMFSLDRTSDD